MATKKTTPAAEVKKLKAELEKLRKNQAADLLKLAEEAYYAGYMDAMVDMDEKAEAMDKFMEKALQQFEKEYTQQKVKKKAAPKKQKVAKKKK